MMHKKTVEKAIGSSMSKATLSFENNNTIYAEIVETKQSQNKIIYNENIKNSNIKQKEKYIENIKNHNIKKTKKVITLLL